MRSGQFHPGDEGHLDASRRRFLSRAAGAFGLGVGLSMGLTMPGCRRTREAGAKPPADEDPEPITRHLPLPGQEPIVRVRVHRRAGDDAEALVIGAEGQWILCRQPDLASFGTPLYGPVQVNLNEGGWFVDDADGFSAPLDPTAPVELRPINEDGDADGEAGSGNDGGGNGDATRPTLRLGMRRFPGSLRLVSRSSDAPAAFDVVNHVNIEDYLPGVVARELYNHWHKQTHAAQAIAARSFACAEHAYFRDRRHFDLTDTQRSQVYGGLVRHRTSLEAVRMTRGMLLVHEDALVPAYYSSCCGGYAARAIDAIGPNPINDIKPLHGRSGTDVCTSASVATWTIERSREVLTRRLIAYGRDNGQRDLTRLVRIASIEPARVNEHGRPTHYFITDIRDHRVEMSAERLRWAANYTGQGLAAPKRPLRSSQFQVTVEGGAVAFRGRGFGHGVGMCQHGAEILARDGRTYDEILNWYYPGAEIRRAYV